MQIRACGTYRCRSQLLTAFSNEGRVALHVVGMLLTITTLVAGARSVLFLLKRISIPKVFRVLGPPLLIGFSLLLAATVRSTTGLLPLLEPRMGMKPTTTERTPPPRKHIFPSSEPVREETQTEAGKERKARESRRERLLRLICGRMNQKAEEKAISSEYGRLNAYYHHVRLLSPEPMVVDNHSLLGSRSRHCYAIKPGTTSELLVIRN